MRGQSTIRLKTGGWVVGRITDFDDNNYYVADVEACPGARALVNPLEDNLGVVPHELVVDVVTEGTRRSCCIDGAGLSPSSPLVLASLPMFDMRHDLCEDCYYRLLGAARDHELYARFMAAHLRGTSSFPSEWTELDESTAYAYELWLISFLRGDEVAA